MPLKAIVRSLSFTRAPRHHPVQAGANAVASASGAARSDAPSRVPLRRRALSFSRATARKQALDGSSAQAASEWALAEVDLFNSGEAEAALTKLGLWGEPRRWQAAVFLHRTQGLDMQQLGELLGKPSCVPLMEAYVQKMDFSNLTLEQALRALLRGFRLPGEAQKIDRILSTFAKHWHRTCEAEAAVAGLNADSAYILAFALIMLNTDQHNPAIKKKKKMTLTQFKSNLRGVGEHGADLPSALLDTLYEAISKDEIKLKGDAKTAGSSAAIVPDLDDAHLRRLRSKFHSLRTVVNAVVRLQRLSRLSQSLGRASEQDTPSWRGSTASQEEGGGESSDEAAPDLDAAHPPSSQAPAAMANARLARSGRLVIPRRWLTAGSQRDSARTEAASDSATAESAREAYASAVKDRTGTSEHAADNRPVMIRRYSSFTKRPKSVLSRLSDRVSERLSARLSDRLSKCSDRASSSRRGSQAQ